MNHHGYIYQATNWIYTGITKARTDKYVEGGKHSRHYDNKNQNGLRKYRSAKHRYIYFATSKTKRKEYMKKLNLILTENPPYCLCAVIGRAFSQNLIKWKKLKTKF